MTPDQPNEGGWNLCGTTEGDHKDEGEGSKEGILDIEGHVEAC